MEESTFSIIFSHLEDPRLDRTKRHGLLDIILLTICAVLCGADSWVDVEEFGHIREEWLKTFLGLPNGIPSHDTIGRVFSMINGKAFERCFMEWVQTLAGLTSKVIAIDGKQIRGSNEVSAAAARNSGQTMWYSVLIGLSLTILRGQAMMISVLGLLRLPTIDSVTSRQA